MTDVALHAPLQRRTAWPMLIWIVLIAGTVAIALHPDVVAWAGNYPKAWIVPAGMKMTSPFATGRHCTKSTIEPSLIAARNSWGVTLYFKPTPIFASGFADMMYHASLLPFGMPIARANVSSG